jgi:phosphohistidine phosphatase
MKILYLVRHSKAKQRKPHHPDFERTLVKSGEKDALSIAKKLKKEGHMPDLLMSSTANRALETAHLFAEGLNFPSDKIMVKDDLYSEISAEALLYIIRKLDNQYSSLMLFGHNPVLTDLASYLIEEFHDDIPKTGVVGIEFPQTEWKAITPRTGRLTLFEYPKRMAKTYKQLSTDLETAIRDEIQEILTRVDPRAAKKEAKMVRQSTEKIVEAFIKNLKQTQTKEEKRALANQRRLLAGETPPAEPAPLISKPAQITRTSTRLAKPSGSRATPASPPECSVSKASPTGKLIQVKAWFASII